MVWRDTLLGLGLALLAATGGVALQHDRLQRLTRQAGDLTPEAIARETARETERLTVLRQTPTFGYDNVVAGWQFLSFLQYFGDLPARQVTGYALSPEYFEGILERDPFFKDAYLFLSTSASMYAGLPQRSIDLMARQLAKMTPMMPEESFYIWRYKAIDELLFLGDVPAAKRSFLQAAAWADVYSDPVSRQVAESSRRTVAFLERNPSSRGAQVSAWSMVLSSAPDPETQKRAVAAIERIGGRLEKRPGGGYGIVLPEKD